LAANAYVNPFTVTAMDDLREKQGAKAVVLLAASSALSKMMIKLCRSKSVEVVCIVRRPEQVSDLQDNYGVKWALNSEAPGFGE
jgi:NADPH:quinone reductase-like Zn-dependent oxidoreductase